MEKICPKCKLTKDITFFTKCKTSNTGYTSDCKECRNKISTEYRNLNRDRYNETQKNWKHKNKEKLSVQGKQQRQNNIEKYRDRGAKQTRLYRLKYPEKVKESQKKWRSKNKEYLTNYFNKKYSENINFKLAVNLRSRFRSALKIKSINKNNSIFELLGCNLDEIKLFLESKFLPTMTWDNYGSYWHIDHIIPCILFDLTKMEDIKKCFHYTNLQPLFAVTQIIDGITYIGNFNKSDKLL